MQAAQLLDEFRAQGFTDRQIRRALKSLDAPKVDTSLPSAAELHEAIDHLRTKYIDIFSNEKPSPDRSRRLALISHKRRKLTAQLPKGRLVCTVSA